MPRGAVRALLVLIQLGYLAMYTLALYKFHDVLRVSHELYASATACGEGHAKLPHMEVVRKDRG